MKKLILLGALLVAAPLFATQPVSIVYGHPESKYDYTNSTISLSSASVTTIAATSNYRQITLTSPTSFYYRLDSSTATIATTGYPAAANTDIVIESSDPIYFLLPVGTAVQTGRYIQKKK